MGPRTPEASRPDRWHVAWKGLAHSFFRRDDRTGGRGSVALSRIFGLVRPRGCGAHPAQGTAGRSFFRSEEHTSELQSIMRISYAVFCLKKKKTQYKNRNIIYSLINKKQNAYRR